MAAVFLNPPSCRLKPFSCGLLSHGPCYQLSLTSNIHPFLVPLVVASVAPGPQEPTPTQAGLWEGTSLGPATQTCTVHSLIQLTFSSLDFCNKYHFLTLLYIQPKANSWLPSNCSYRRPTLNTQLRVNAALMSHLFLEATLNSFSTGLGMSFTAQCFFLAFHRSASSFFCRFSSPSYPMSVSPPCLNQCLFLLSILLKVCVSSPCYPMSGSGISPSCRFPTTSVSFMDSLSQPLTHTSLAKLSYIPLLTVTVPAALFLSTEDLPGLSKNKPLSAPSIFRSFHLNLFRLPTIPVLFCCLL